MFCYAARFVTDRHTDHLYMYKSFALKKVLYLSARSAEEKFQVKKSFHFVILCPYIDKQGVFGYFI